jgi:hypothetical protein
LSLLQGANFNDVLITLLNVAQTVALALLAARGEITAHRVKATERRTAGIRRDLDHTLP